MYSDRDLENFLRLAIDLAVQGGQLAKSLIGKTQSSLKDDKSIVTEADKLVQDMIVRSLADQVPTHGLIAEESTALTSSLPGSESEFVWTIDPIDGTRNYAVGISVFCCSVALLHHGRPIVGAIYEPNVNWLFSADIQSTAKLNNKNISLRREKFIPDESVVAYSLNTHASRPSSLHTLLDQCITRNTGTSALHLGMLAAGMIDAAVILGGKLWDIAAGALITEQAGGKVCCVDSEGKITDRPLWPIDLQQYRNEPIPLFAASDNFLADLKAIL